MYKRQVDIFYSIGISNTLGLLFNILAYLIIATLFGVQFSVTLIFIPILIFTILGLGLGLGMIICVIRIYVQDVKHIVNIILLLAFWTSGVFFPAQRVKDFWEPLFYINPFLGILDNTRNILVFDRALDTKILFVNFTFSFIIFLMGKHFINNYSHKYLEKL